MNLFHIIEGGAVIISVAGKYQQASVYHRGDDVFACIKNDYIKLLPMNGTSVPNIKWWDIEANGVVIARIGAPRFYEDIEAAATAFSQSKMVG